MPDYTKTGPKPFDGPGSTRGYDPKPGQHADPQEIAENPWEPKGTEEQRIEKNVIAKLLKEKFQSEIIKITDFRGDLAVTLKRDKIVDICWLLLENKELNFDLFIDLCGVHYPERKGKELEVVYHLYSVNENHRVRLKVPLNIDDPEINSIHEVWRGVNWFEREAFDLLGIKFIGHPNLRRLLTHDEFEGHPLRKDYPYWKGQPLSRIYPVIRDNKET